MSFTLQSPSTECKCPAAVVCLYAHMTLCIFWTIAAEELLLQGSLQQVACTQVAILFSDVLHIDSFKHLIGQYSALNCVYTVRMAGNDAGNLFRQIAQIWHIILYYL